MVFRESSRQMLCSIYEIAITYIDVEYFYELDIVLSLLKYESDLSHFSEQHLISQCVFTYDQYFNIFSRWSIFLLRHSSIIMILRR